VIGGEMVAENAWRLGGGLYRILLPLPLAVPFVSVYLVASGGQHLLIDAGMGGDGSLRALGRALKAIGVGELDRIVLTHRHPDHAGGAAKVQGRWGGQLLLHPACLGHEGMGEAEALDWALALGVPRDHVARLAPGRPRSPGADALGPAAPLDASVPLVLGDLAFRLIEVPGHAPGQVMLHERSRGWLCAADQVVEPEAPNVWLAPGVGGDPFGQYLASLRRTAAIEADIVLPSHGPPFAGGLREHALRQIAWQESYLARVAALVAGGPVTGWQVACRMAQRDEAVTASQLAEVAAALRHLEATGRLARDGDGYRPGANEPGVEEA
jgi:glyoxylase-like metal-dependent hydrolase (beta-lactamase superfamily II)